MQGLRQARCHRPEVQVSLRDKLAMKIRRWLWLIGLPVGLCLGCGRSSEQNAQVQIKFASLVAECRELARDGASKGKDMWNADDSLPPTVKSLSPQFVDLLVSSTATIIDIQVSGGFRHRGYLVVCESKDPNLVPEKSPNWRVTRLAPDV